MRLSRHSCPSEFQRGVKSRSFLGRKLQPLSEGFTTRIWRAEFVPIPDAIRGPGEAIEALQRLIGRTPTIFIRPRDFADDLLALRSVFTDDEDYTAALVAFWKEIRRALRDKERYGGADGELSRNLVGVRRAKFPLEDRRNAVLRLSIRPYGKGIQIIAMRHRHQPTGMYRLSAERLSAILQQRVSP